MSQETKVLTGIGLVTGVILIGAVLLLGKGNNPTSNNNQPVKADNRILIRADSNEIATSSAKVTLVEFGDYQCPACGAAHPIVKQILTDFTGKINFVFRNFPLPMHQNAQIAAEAAEASGSQGKYWQMHDKLYENQNQWGESSDPMSYFLTYAKDLNLNVDQFKTDVQNNKFQSKINQDIADGNTLGVDATPTFYINGYKYTGNLSYDSLKSAVQAAIK